MEEEPSEKCVKVYVPANKGTDEWDLSIEKPEKGKLSS